MRKAIRICVGIVAIALAASSAPAQQRGGSPDRGGRGAQPDRGTASTESRYRSGSVPTHNYHTPVPSVASETTPGGGNFPGGAAAPGYYSFYPANYYYAQNFLYGLYSRYPYFSLDQYFWRYSVVGDSPLDRDLLRLALRDSYEAANDMVGRADELSSLLDKFEAGQVERKMFQQSFDSQISEIRKLAKSIRKDERLGFLDQRKGLSAKAPAEAASVSELRGLVETLREQTTHIRLGLENYYVRDYTRTIEVDHLKQPSFKSMSEHIDKLAKVIGKSADKM